MAKYNAYQQMAKHNAYQQIYKSPWQTEIYVKHIHNNEFKLGFDLFSISIIIF